MDRATKCLATADFCGRGENTSGWWKCGETFVSGTAVSCPEVWIWTSHYTEIYKQIVLILFSSTTVDIFIWYVLKIGLLSLSNSCIFHQQPQADRHHGLRRTHVIGCLEEPVLGRLSVGDGLLGGERLRKGQATQSESSRRQQRWNPHVQRSRDETHLPWKTQHLNLK